MAFLDETGLGRIIERFKNIFVPATRTINGLPLTSDINIPLSGGSSISPHLWSAGIEYDFGDGSFGIRVEGAVSGSANTGIQVNLFTAESPSIIDCGGWIVFGGDTRALQNARDQNAQRFAIIVARGDLLFMVVSDITAYTNKAFDVWIKYTKNTI